MNVEAFSHLIAPGEAYIHVQIVSEVEQIFWCLKKETVPPFTVKVVVKQVVKLVDGVWQKVSVEFY